LATKGELWAFIQARVSDFQSPGAGFGHYVHPAPDRRRRELATRAATAASWPPAPPPACQISAPVMNGRV